MNLVKTPRRAAATILLAAVLGAGSVAGVYATVDGSATVDEPSAVTRASSVADTSADLTVGQIYNRNRASVVELTVTTTASGGSQSFPFGGTQTEQAQGTGFVYDTSGDIVTNEHVVDGATKIVVTFADGTKATATLVGSDTSDDLAVVHVNVDSSKLHPVVLGDSSKVAVGDGVVAIGAPFGLAESVTSGIVSAVGRNITAPNDATIAGAIQTDAAINHGNSGGPLFDLHGRVIGVTAQIESESGGNDGVGFAIPSNTVKNVVDQLVAGETVKHAQLGVQIEDGANGAAVAAVTSGSAAAKAGIRTGDTIVAVDGDAVTSASSLAAAISSHRPGDTVKITVLRDGARKTLTATLDARSS